MIEWSEEYLVDLGVPRRKIVKLNFYKSGTIYDVLAVKKYVFMNGINSLIIVTSDYHTRRTLWTFRQLLSNYRIKLSTCSAKSLRDSTKEVVLENIKRTYYRVRFGFLRLIPELMN
jgi:uncharacterized SAM-binding protein YcdF (DUF218 family)